MDVVVYSCLPLKCGEIKFSRITNGYEKNGVLKYCFIAKKR
jgi:hypothetical protein